MATPTYTPIETFTVSGSSTRTITFGSGGTIPQTYTDLILIAVAGEPTGSYMKLRFNGDTGSSYSRTIMIGNGSSATSARASNATSMFINTGTTNGNNVNKYAIQNYSNPNVNKSVLGLSATSADIFVQVGLWRNTNAITSISLEGGDTNFASGSTFALYGIANADIGAKATGGIITYDNTYYYHTFGASGTFTPKQSLTADILVVAGGGAGGGYSGGGGGAGGILGFANQSLTATGYTVSVGAGGSAGTSNNPTSGVNSQFGTLTAAIGGGRGGTGGGSSGVFPANGGSGGGAGSSGGAYNVPGTGTSGQGNNGGATANGWPGGGGGAGAAGTAGSGSSTNGANGGIGISTYNSWSLITGVGQNVSGTYYLAGGGGGAGGAINSTVAAGTGGLGGGGAGGTLHTGTGDTVVNSTPGIANTGGGGGGGNNGTVNGPAASGGSGVVIIRYLKA